MSWNVAIVGCGTAGPATALFLRRAGHKVTVFERAQKLKPVGAGITLQPTGQFVLERLGLLDTITKLATPLRHLYAKTRSDRTILDLHYTELHPTLTGYGLHRGALFQTLLDAMLAEEEGSTEVCLHCDSEIVQILPEDGFKASVLDIRGEKHGVFDLILLADGARSHLRRSSPYLRKSETYSWGAIWAVLPDEERYFSQREQLFQRLDGNHKMLGFLPTGRRSLEEEAQVSLFWSLPTNSIARWRERGINAWKEEVIALEPEAARLLEHIEEQDQLIFAFYHDVVMSRWDHLPLVVLGDAGHAMGPQLGQGANLALLDAMVFCDTLAQFSDRATALQCFSRRRKANVRFYQLATRWLTPLFQSDFAPLGWLRDLTFGPMHLLPPVRRQMLRSMCGFKRGILRPSFPLQQFHPASVAVPEYLRSLAPKSLP
jgi:2-polyprenyl-6-methoxyphenol hydroxylase-like FAD-dependent oxidoreductase